MLHSPDTLRPDHSVAPFIPGGAAPLDDPEIARRMARVILRQAGDGQATELRHFREAEETKGLSTDELVRHLGAARRQADAKVIRQDAVGWSPEHKGDSAFEPVSDATSPRPSGERATRDLAVGACARAQESVRGEGCSASEGDVASATDEQLIAIVLDFAAPQISDAALASLALEAGLRPAAIARIWDRLKARLASDLVTRPRPSLGALAAHANGIKGAL